MTPLQFEQSHQHEWQELQTLLAQLHKSIRARSGDGKPIAGERVAALYRRACEQLALARARAYPAYLVDRLEQLTADAHQLIYQQVEFGWDDDKKGKPFKVEKYATDVTQQKRRTACMQVRSIRTASRGRRSSSRWSGAASPAGTWSPSSAAGRGWRRC